MIAEVKPQLEKQSLPLDRDAAIAQLSALGYKNGDTVYLRKFPPKGVKGQAKNLSYTLPGLPHSQDADGGLYFVVNGGGQKDEDVVEGKAIFFEHDDRSIEEQIFVWQEKELPEPTMQIATRKSCHTYFTIRGGCSIADWKELQCDLLEYVDGDRTLKNPSRVMRLAGAWHIKADAESIRCDIINQSGQSYTYEELRAVIPRRQQKKQKVVEIQPNRTNASDGDRTLSEFLHQDVLPRLSPEQIYNWSGHDWQPDHSGTKYRGCCPWHESQSGTAFFIDRKDGEWLWNCSGCNNIGGGAIQYRHRLKNGDGRPRRRDFVDLVAELAAEAGVPMPEYRHEQQNSNQPAAKLKSDFPIAYNKNGDPKLPHASIAAAYFSERYYTTLAWNVEGVCWCRYEAEHSGVWSQESDVAIGAVLQAEIDATGLGYGSSYIADVMKLLRYKLLQRKWIETAGLIAFRNGVLDVATGKLLEHSPGYRLTGTLPRDYSPIAGDWSKISTWMDEATGGNTKLKNILLCFLNACLKRRSDLQRFLHLTGVGGSGKGTFLRLATNLIGEANTLSTTLQEWCMNRFESASAYQKRLVAFWDEDKYIGGLSRFKSLTGGDYLRAEAKNKPVFQFRYDGMVILSSEVPIFAGDTGSGMARRSLIVPFNHSVEPGKRRNLDAEFEPELAALTNYVLSIPDEVVTATLLQTQDASADVLSQTWEYRMQTDSIASWLNECLVADPNASERIGGDKADIYTLFGSYWQYCDRIGARPKNSREFSPALLDLCKTLRWEVSKTRMTCGFVLNGLRLRLPSDSGIPQPLESFSGDVGSASNVESNAGCNVGSEPIQGKAYVGYVGSANLVREEKNIEFEEKQPTATAVEPEPSKNPNGKNELPSPYIPYISQSQQDVQPYIAPYTMQGEPPYIAPIQVGDRVICPRGEAVVRSIEHDGYRVEGRDAKTGLPYCNEWFPGEQVRRLDA